MTRSTRILALAATSFVLSAGLVTAAPPTPQACSDPDLGARVRCKFDNVVAQQDATTDMLTQMPEIPDKQKEALMNQRDRLMTSFGRTAPDDYKQLAKKKDPQCQVAEVLNDGKGDDDGICTGNEDCLEVIGDQIGDDIQPCKTTGKPSEREVCVSICDSEAVDSNPDNFDETGRGKDLEDELDDATEQYEALNQVLEQVVMLRSAPPANLAGSTLGPCDQDLSARTSNTLMWASLIAKLTMETIADVSDKFCNQDVLGNNAATACAVVVVGKAAAVDTWEVLDQIDGNRDSDPIDTSYDCLHELNTSVGESNDALTSIETKVDSLDQQVKMLQQQLDDVMTLLSTPQGQRPGFPMKKK